MIYNQDQFINDALIHLHVPCRPEWLIIGGPADGNEAQCAVKQWPDIKVIGAEPNEKMVQWQKENGWPEEAPLLRKALSDRIATVPMHFPAGRDRCASLLPERPGELKMVRTTTIDSIDAVLGPINNAILWLDIEGSEFAALLGARGVLAANKVILVNVEAMANQEKTNKLVHELLISYGFRTAHTWNVQEGLCKDVVYVRKHDVLP